ncbi:glycerophosphoryl diester phosphodiesterase membrane domain-containing protein [Streptosporangium sp. NPDC004379]|uniref:glycerophosphoryl diester phosphodiesterase membrane domain-containing protein n=1 Tax=Streptosporangium sp. NPDC004379 TaxID=3366189 RepID=UPI0036C42B9C
MSDGHDPAPDTPSGWAAHQPPPYQGVPGSPWTAPGPPPASPAGPAQGGHPPYGGPPHPGGPYGPGPDAPPYGPGPQPPYGRHPQPAALRPGIIPLRPLGLGDILDGAIKLIRSNPKTVLGLSAIAAVLGVIPTAVGQAVVFGQIGAAVNDPSALDGVGESGFLGQYGDVLVSYAVEFVVVTLLTGVLTRILGRAVFGGRTTAGEAWRLSRGRMPALFGLVALEALLMLVPVVLISLVIVALANAGAGAGTAVAVGALAVLGYIAYAAFVSTRLALAAPAAVLERRGALDSMRRSWRLVNGGFWRTLGILILTRIITFLITFVVAVPFTFGAALVSIGVPGSTGAQVATAVLIAIGGTVGAMITYPFLAGVNGLLYADRRMRSEAFDLVLQTAAIEQRRQGWVHATADDLWLPSATPGAPGPHPQAGQGASWPHS